MNIIELNQHYVSFIYTKPGSLHKIRVKTSGKITTYHTSTAIKDDLPRKKDFSTLYGWLHFVIHKT